MTCKRLNFVLAAFLCSFALLAGAAAGEVTTSPKWAAPVNGQENAQAYRDFWKARIQEDLGRYAFIADPNFCKNEQRCAVLLRRLNEGQFELIAPDVFSVDDIKPVLAAGAEALEKQCPQFFFQNGVYLTSHDGGQPPQKAPYAPTRNFALYDLTARLLPRERAGISAIKVVRAEHYYLYDEETHELTSDYKDWGGVSLLTLPDCKRRGLLTAYTSDISNDIERDPYPGIRELVVLEGRVYALGIQHTRGKTTADDPGIVSLALRPVMLKQGEDTFMSYKWGQE